MVGESSSLKDRGSSQAATSPQPFGVLSLKRLVTLPPGPSACLLTTNAGTQGCCFHVPYKPRCWSLPLNPYGDDAEHRSEARGVLMYPVLHKEAKGASLRVASMPHMCSRCG